MKEDTQYCPIKRWVPLLLLSVLYVANNVVVIDDGDNGRKVSDVAVGLTDLRVTILRYTGKVTARHESRDLRSRLSCYPDRPPDSRIRKWA